MFSNLNLSDEPTMRVFMDIFIDT